METAATINGLNTDQVAASRLRHGSNELHLQEQRKFWQILKEIVAEPMFVILLAACIIYFVVGQYQEGFIMLIAIFIVSGISFLQEYRSQNAIQALKKIAAPLAEVIRNGKSILVATEELVVDDMMLLTEGQLVPADGTIICANDFSVNESILTGESFAIHKSESENNSVSKGTLIISGSATAKVTAVGALTQFGKIGLSLQEISIVKTPLQLQIRSFIIKMVWIGAIAFCIVVGYNYFDTGNLVASFLRGLTLAMSILPEEIPVAFSTFQALGAFRLLKNNIIVKQPQYVETLGSATVICADKTGTLTQNKMSIQYLYDAVANETVEVTKKNNIPARLVAYAMWSSETTAFDPMEKAIHELYEKTCETDQRTQFKQVNEYPNGGRPPMMTHIFKNEKGTCIIAAKGAAEAILKQSHLNDADAKIILDKVLEFAQQGYRVMGVGCASWPTQDWPKDQSEFKFEFLGLLVFYDPPKENIAATIKTFNDAGIQIKMITGDYAATALAIAAQINLRHNNAVLTGTEVLDMPAEELRAKVKDINIYARMFPEAKLKVINALKDNGEIVAMTGDGVNDGPALKAAHIGIAMGKRGSDVAKSAASIILTDDDLSHMTAAVAMGRKIYDNLKKAIQYIVSIHIPIILIVTLPLLLMWTFTDIFSPVHVIFLELIMGPTCSIIYENEPMEAGSMQRQPRAMNNTFLSSKQLMVSIAQGLAITAGCLGIGYYFLLQQQSESMVRTVIFITLLFSNIFLTLINRSFRYSVFKTIFYKNNLVPLIIGITLLLIGCFVYIPWLQQLFRLTSLSFYVMAACIGTAFVSTCWVEIIKALRKN